MNYKIIWIIIIILFIIGIFGISSMRNYFKLDNRMNIESFDDFSPYAGNQLYPFVYEKHKDQKMLRATLKRWEDPFNTNDEGYYNAEPGATPPLVPIYSYDDIKEVRFNENQNIYS